MKTLDTWRIVCYNVSIGYDKGKVQEGKMSKVQLTDGQRARIERQMKEWGGSVEAGLVRIYGDSLNALMTPQEAAATTDREMAYRVAWIRQARRVGADKPVVVTGDMIGAVLAEM